MTADKEKIFEIPLDSIKEIVEVKKEVRECFQDWIDRFGENHFKSFVFHEYMLALLKIVKGDLEKLPDIIESGLRIGYMIYRYDEERIEQT